MFIIFAVDALAEIFEACLSLIPQAAQRLVLPAPLFAHAGDRDRPAYGKPKYTDPTRNFSITHE